MTKRTLKDISERKGASLEKQREYVEKLSRLVNCKTVFTKSGENAAEFEKFYSEIDKIFPTLAEKAERLSFGGGCFVYIVRGKNASRNIMLMSHHDVVEGSDSWESDPFVATERDGYLFGRGTIDTKTPLFAELQAVEELLSDGHAPDGFDLYIASSNNEEVSGDGMVLATEYFKKNGVFFDVVLDEGGAITEGQIPGVKAKSAVVAVHEKSRHTYKCTARLDSKGHGGFGGASDNALERMSHFITEVSDRRDKIYKGRFYPEVRATFERHAPYMSFPLNVLFGNIGVFSPIIKKIMMGIPAARAMLSTGVSFTTLSAGDAAEPHLRAKSAEAMMFLRCVREEDLERGLSEIRDIGKKWGVEIELIERDYCKPTSFESDAFKLVESLLNDNFPDVIVAPFLLTAGTDARRLTDVAENILRFAPIDLNKKQFASIHADNEHIGIENIGECVVFYKDLLLRLMK